MTGLKHLVADDMAKTALHPSVPALAKLLGLVGGAAGAGYLAEKALAGPSTDAPDPELDMTAAEARKARETKGKSSEKPKSKK